MIVLGIADNHDSGAALVIDGQLVQAVNQERVDRIKNSGVFPWGAIDQICLNQNINYKDIDRIVIGSAFTPSALLRSNPKSHATAKEHGQFSTLLHGYLTYQSVLRRSGFHTLEIDACRKILAERLKARPFETIDLQMMDHHQCHAEGAYRTQHRSEALVLTVDAMGDGLSATVWHGKDGELRKLWDQSGLSAVSLFYSRITELLGFKALRHEGKITGLAALAEPNAELVNHFQSRVSFEGNRFSRISVWELSHAKDAFWSKIQQYDAATVAASAQFVLEKVLCQFVQYWVKRTGLSDICLAGGLFANVKLNQRIQELPEVQSVWIMPHMGDGGLAAGAALGSADAPPRSLPHAYLGFIPTTQDTVKALGRHNLQRQKSNISQIADCLINHGVVARCAGAMEWGPRALGNRSILAIPNDRKLNDTLNARLQRTEFMPFAPILRDVDAKKYFDIPEIWPCLEFMTMCVNANALFQDHCPAAVHVDQTARPQILKREQNPEIYDVLTEIDQRTGHGVLINTSFNMHEEPIVCTADDAVRAFLASDMEGLWLGEYFTFQQQKPS